MVRSVTLKDISFWNYKFEIAKASACTIAVGTKVRSRTVDGPIVV